MCIQRNKIISIPPFSSPSLPDPLAHFPDLHIDKRWQMAVSGVKHHLYGKSHLCFLNFLSLCCNLCAACTSVFLYHLISCTDYTESKTLKHEHWTTNSLSIHFKIQRDDWLFWDVWSMWTSPGLYGIQKSNPISPVQTESTSSLALSLSSLSLWRFLLRNMAVHNKSQDSQIFLQNICHITTFDQSH